MPCRHMLIIGDAVDCLVDIPAGSIHACVTSPPYFGLRDYEVEGQIGKDQTEEEYIQWLAAVGDLVMEALRPSGTYWLNIGDSYDDAGLRLLPHRLALEMQRRGWHVHMDNVWRKTRYMPNGGKRRPVLIHEYVFMFSKQGERHDYYPDAVREPHSPVSLKRWAASGVAKLGGKRSMGTKDAIDGHQTNRVTANPLGKLKSSVWDICPSNYRGEHCATFPEKLAETCIHASTLPGETILDPFFGAGTTGVVCERLGRHWLGIELNPATGEEALERIRIAKEKVA